MNNFKVQILIPTYNNYYDIDETIESIREQSYNADNIYITIVDFGSTDGTYEKILSLDMKNLGIYRKEGIYNKRQMIAESEKILKYVRPGHNCFSVLLYPGDIIYKNCLELCVKEYIKNLSVNPVAIICEVAVCDKNNAIRKQSHLYPSNKILDGENDTIEYVKRGYQHYVFAIVTIFGNGKHKYVSEINELRFWNKCVRKGNGKNVIYISEEMALVKEIDYEDELEEILYRWESIISFERVFKSRYKKQINDEFTDVALCNVSKYALWRSWNLFNRNDKKNAEGCLLIAGVINPAIKKEDIYKSLKQLIECDIEYKNVDVEKFFLEEN